MAALNSAFLSFNQYICYLNLLITKVYTIEKFWFIMKLYNILKILKGDCKMLIYKDRIIENSNNKISSLLSVNFVY